MIDFIDPFTYLLDHSNAIREVIETTTETLTTGKYVLNFFESLLKKATGKSGK